MRCFASIYVVSEEAFLEKQERCGTVTQMPPDSVSSTANAPLVC